MWVGPYSIEIDYAITTGFDILGYVPGTEIINVPFTKQLEDKFCSLHTCNISEQKITIVEEEGIFDDYLVVGSIGAFLENINDSEACAFELIDLLKDMPCKLNLIPYNEIGGKFSRPKSKSIDAFIGALKNAPFTVTIRWSMVSMIDAGCGQLAVKN